MFILHYVSIVMQNIPITPFITTTQERFSSLQHMALPSEEFLSQQLLPIAYAMSLNTYTPCTVDWCDPWYEAQVIVWSMDQW
jgi:hypothetical protein